MMRLVQSRNPLALRRGDRRPVSSRWLFSCQVWDRAVELFYQIKGGTVDYGKEHSALHGHARFG